MATQLTRIETNTQTLIKQVKQLTDAFNVFVCESENRFDQIMRRFDEIEAKLDGPPPQAVQELRVTVGDPIAKE